MADRSSGVLIYRVLSSVIKACAKGESEVYGSKLSKHGPHQSKVAIILIKLKIYQPKQHRPQYRRRTVMPTTSLGTY